MIEATHRIKYILQHPTKDHKLEIQFYNDTMMDDWLPYLDKFEDALITERIKYIASKNKQ